MGVSEIHTAFATARVASAPLPLAPVCRPAQAAVRGWVTGSWPGGGGGSGGIAGLARLAEHSIKQVEVLAYPELDMEAVWRIEVEDFPAFIVVNHEGRDFCEDLRQPPEPPLAQIRTGQ